MANIIPVSTQWNYLKGPKNNLLTSILERTPENNETYGKYAFNKMVAIFNIHGTLIQPKHGSLSYKDENDWEVCNDNIIKKLTKLHKKGISLAFIDNCHFDTSEPRVYEILKAEMQHRIDKFIKALQLPVYVYISLKPDSFQKPYSRIFDYFNYKFVENNVVIDKAVSVVVGHLGGRIKQKGHENPDMGTLDRAFALNIGFQYIYPERTFMNNKTDYIWKWPKSMITTEEKIEFLSIAKIPAPKISDYAQQMYLIIGPPRSTKTSTADKFCEFWNKKCVPCGKSAMKIVRQETIYKGSWGTIDMCLNETKTILQQGYSVIIDANLPDNETRSKFINLAQDDSESKNNKGVFVGVIEINVPAKICKHLNNFTCSAYINVNFEPKALLPMKHITKYWKDYQSAETFVKKYTNDGNKCVVYQKSLYLFPNADKKEMFLQYY